VVVSDATIGEYDTAAPIVWEGRVYMTNPDSDVVGTIGQIRAFDVSASDARPSEARSDRHSGFFRRRAMASNDTEHEHTPDEERQIREAALDQTIEGSFPASDPPSSNPNPDDHAAFNDQDSNEEQTNPASPDHAKARR
jgi:hypothetical protein